MAARARATNGVQNVEGRGSAPARRKPKPASAADDAAPSPALMLQQALHSELSEAEPKKWHPAATLGFIVGTCGAFWGLVAFGVAVALK